jgi:hypothetical protein
MRELADAYFAKAERVRVVPDNLSTRSVGALSSNLPSAEMRRLLHRLELHQAPSTPAG